MNISLSAVPMSALHPGERATVRGIAVDGDMRRRLQDIGLIRGTPIECVGRSPLGDPTAFRIRGAVIALRRADTAQIRVERSWD